MSAEAEARRIADAQLAAYNACDLGVFCALFHDDAVLVNLPGQEIVATGMADIRVMYERRFAMPGLRCQVHHRSELGAVAIDRETVYSDGQPPVDILAMYEVTGGKIARIFFIRGGVI